MPKIGHYQNLRMDYFEGPCQFAASISKRFKLDAKIDAKVDTETDMTTNVKIIQLWSQNAPDICRMQK